MAKLNTKTIVLTGTERAAKLSGQNCDIRNDGADIVYASGEADILAGADGVMPIPAGQAVKLLDVGGTVYLLGTGSVQVCGNDYAQPVFKVAATSSSGEGGGTVDADARKAIGMHAGNAEIHVTAEEREAWNGKTTLAESAEVFSSPNLLINPDFSINQRGLAEYTSAGYTVDGWKFYGDPFQVKVVENGIELVNTNGSGAGYLAQRLEKRYFDIGDNITISFLCADGTLLSASDVVTNTWGTAIVKNNDGIVAYYEYATNTVLLRVLAGKTLAARAIKLELGTVSTLNGDGGGDSAIELVKCQRNYEVLMDAFVDRSIIGVLNPITGKVTFDFSFKATKRVAPSLATNKVRLVVVDYSTNTIVYAQVVELAVHHAGTEGITLVTTIPDTVALSTNCSATIDTLTEGVPALAVSAEQ